MRCAGVACQIMWRAMCRDDIDLRAHLKFCANVGGFLHRWPVRVASHQDAHHWAFHIFISHNLLSRRSPGSCFPGEPNLGRASAKVMLSLPGFGCERSAGLWSALLLTYAATHCAKNFRLAHGGRVSGAQAQHGLAAGG